MNKPAPATDIDALRAEHDSVRRHLEHAREVADSVGEASVHELKQSLDHAIHTIAHQFLPHAQHEEDLLYARFLQAPGTPSVAAVLERDHDEFAQLVDELRLAHAEIRDPLPADLARQLRRILYGMYAIMKLHFATEDDLYLNAVEEKTYRLRNDA